MPIIESVELGKVIAVLINDTWLKVNEGSLKETSGGLTWENGSEPELEIYFAEKAAISAVRTK